MKQATILIADDDTLIVDALEYQLEREGYKVLTALDGEETLQSARKHQPDLILLDIMMPKLQGWEVCRQLRSESSVPILMLTARGEEVDRVLGLELGADDYIVKPFSFRELLARIRANLRRVSLMEPLAQPPAVDEEQQIGPLSIDLRRRMVMLQGEVVVLSYKEFDLLATLLAANGAFVTREQLLETVWGGDRSGPGSRTLDVHIRWLRSKLEIIPGKPHFILTARGVGYRLITADEFPN